MAVNMLKLRQAKDAPLIRLFRLGNNYAFDVLVLRYEKGLKVYFHALVHNAYAEKELLQALWIAVVRLLRQHRYKEEGHFKDWIFTLAYRMAVSFRRKKKAVSEPVPKEIPDDNPLTAQETVIRKEQIRIIKETIEKLNKNYREVIRMRVEEEKSFKEIAAQTHSDIHTVTSRFSKAVKKLRELIRGKGK